MCSAIGLILCQYVTDNIFRWLNHDTVYALQLMPEAKILTDNSTGDHQAFASNYFSLSIGFLIVMAVGLVYGLLFRMN